MERPHSAERTQNSSKRYSRSDLLLVDDLPGSIRRRFDARREAEGASLTIGKKPIGFWSNRSLAREQVEPEFRDLPEALKYWEASPSVRRRIDGSRGKERKKYVDFQAAIPRKGRDAQELLDARHVSIPSKWLDTIKNS